MIRRVRSEVLAIGGPVQLDHMGRVAEASAQAAVLPVVLLHLHHHGDDVVYNGGDEEEDWQPGKCRWRCPSTQEQGDFRLGRT